MRNKKGDPTPDTLEFGHIVFDIPGPGHRGRIRAIDDNELLVFGSDDTAAGVPLRTLASGCRVKYLPSGGNDLSPCGHRWARCISLAPSVPAATKAPKAPTGHEHGIVEFAITQPGHQGRIRGTDGELFVFARDNCDAHTLLSAIAVGAKVRYLPSMHEDRTPNGHRRAQLISVVAPAPAAKSAPATKATAPKEEGASC